MYRSIVMCIESPSLHLEGVTQRVGRRRAFSPGTDGERPLKTRYIGVGNGKGPKGEKGREKWNGRKEGSEFLAMDGDDAKGKETHETSGRARRCGEAAR